MGGVGNTGIQFSSAQQIAPEEGFCSAKPDTGDWGVEMLRAQTVPLRAHSLEELGEGQGLEGVQESWPFASKDK